MLRIETITSGPWRENCYIVHDDGGTAVAIDPGGATEDILSVIETNRLHLVAILNTHAHFDHVGGVSELKERHNAPFCLHSADRRLLAQANFYRRTFGGDRAIVIPDVDIDLAPGGLMQFGAMTVEIIASPGHTPGGVSLLVGDKLFTGDNMLGKRIGRTDLPGGDAHALRDTIRTLFRLPPTTLGYPGHGSPATLGEIAEANSAVAEILA
jgi:glyoxylase-like metal-dependent hydrolase (beta-lactamase superfamily II)